MQERGYTVLGLCPDLPEGLQQVHGDKKLHFPLYSDSSVALCSHLGLVFHVDDATFGMFRSQYNIDIEKASGQSHHNLPVPAVYVLDKAATVKFVYTNADYKIRLTTEELLTHAN